MDRLSSFTSRFYRLEQGVDLAHLLVDVPGAGPSPREHRDVAGSHLDRGAVVGLHGHPAGDEVDRLVLLQQPARRAGFALPDADRDRPILPESDAPGGHRRAGALLERAPVLEGRGGGVGGVWGEHGRRGHALVLSGNGSAIGSAARMLRPPASKRSSPRSVTSTTSVLPVSRRSAAVRATAGPHIIPWPPGAAMIAPLSGPAGVSSGPMIGRWSGV